MDYRICIEKNEKKKIVLFLLAGLLLCGCVSTPEEEFVVNKGDDSVQVRINANPVQESDKNAAQLFPSRWDADPKEVGERFTIAAHANVITKADGIYPVYRSRRIVIDKDYVVSLANKMLSKPISVGKGVMTKDDWSRALKTFLADVDEWERWVAAGKPDWGDRDESGYSPEYVEKQTAWYMDQIRNAPEHSDSKPVSDFSDIELRKQLIYSLMDGSQAYIGAYQDSLTITKYGGLGYIYDYDIYQMELHAGDTQVSSLWHNVTLAREEAEAILTQELACIGFEDFSIQSAQIANLILLDPQTSDNPRYASSGWAFKLWRNPGGYPTTEVSYAPSQSLKYGESDEFIANAPNVVEELMVFIDAEGLQSLYYLSPKKITGVANANVELLSFDQVQERAIQSLSMCFPIVKYREMYQGSVIPLEIYSMLLTTYPVREKNGDGFYEMPCWVVFFDGQYTIGLRALGESEDMIREVLLRNRNDTHLEHDVLILNAVDGSIIHTDWGY